MVKPYATYQNLNDGIITDRDKRAVGSKFWNEGKWENFVAPHLPQDCTGLSFVDMGCNAGLFLHLASKRGFGKIIGVDSDSSAVERGRQWAQKNGETYAIIEAPMEKVIDQLPIVDYTVLCNAHYYFTVNDWLDYLDQLRLKTRYVIIVTAEKNHINRCWASADVASIRTYFKDWKEVSFVDELPTEGDPDPRRLWSLCFESPVIEKVPVEPLDSSNHVQDQFYGELDKGKHYTETRYYRILVKYRAKWGLEKLNRWMEERVRVYTDLKKNGLMKPIIVDQGVLILDGNHRFSMMRNLGYKEVFIRRTA